VLAKSRSHRIFPAPSPSARRRQPVPRSLLADKDRRLFPDLRTISGESANPPSGSKEKREKEKKVRRRHRRAPSQKEHGRLVRPAPKAQKKPRPSAPCQISARKGFAPRASSRPAVIEITLKRKIAEAASGPSRRGRSLSYFALFLVFRPSPSPPPLPWRLNKVDFADQFARPTMATVKKVHVERSGSPDLEHDHRKVGLTGFSEIRIMLQTKESRRPLIRFN